MEMKLDKNLYAFPGDTELFPAFILLFLIRAMIGNYSGASKSPILHPHNISL